VQKIIIFKLIKAKKTVFNSAQEVQKFLTYYSILKCFYDKFYSRKRKKKQQDKLCSNAKMNENKKGSLLIRNRVFISIQVGTFCPHPKCAGFQGLLFKFFKCSCFIFPQSDRRYRCFKFFLLQP